MIFWYFLHMFAVFLKFYLPLKTHHLSFLWWKDLAQWEVGVGKIPQVEQYIRISGCFPSKKLCSTTSCFPIIAITQSVPLQKTGFPHFPPKHFGKQITYPHFLPPPRHRFQGTLLGTAVRRDLVSPGLAKRQIFIGKMVGKPLGWGPL